MGIAQDRHLDKFIDYNGVTAKIGDEFIRDFSSNRALKVVGIAVEGISGSELYYSYKLRYQYVDQPHSRYSGCMYISTFAKCIILNKFKSIQIK